MAQEIRPELNVLRLCPSDEETLEDFASDVIEILKIPSKKQTNRRVIEAKLKLFRILLKPSNCVGTNQLCGISNFELLYKNNSSVFNVDSSTELSDCVILGKQLILSCLNTELKNSLIKLVLSNILFHRETKQASSFLLYVWQMRDDIPLATDTIEELIRGFPLCLELFLLDMVDELIFSENKTVHAIVDDVDPLCKLCSDSCKIFQLTLTILHEFFLISNGNERLLNCISMFVQRVESHCKSGGFLDLFPDKLQLLIIILHVNPSIYPSSFYDEDFTMDGALKTLSSFMCKDRRVGTALLSYYPKWLPFLLKYCVNSNISILLPESEIADDSFILYLKFLIKDLV